MEPSIKQHSAAYKFGYISACWWTLAGNQLSDHRFVCKVINLQVSLSFFFDVCAMLSSEFRWPWSKQRSFHVSSEHVWVYAIVPCTCFCLFVCVLSFRPASQLMIAQWRKPLGCVAIDLVVLLVLPLMASQSSFMGLNSHVFFVILVAKTPKKTLQQKHSTSMHAANLTDWNQ